MPTGTLGRDRNKFSNKGGGILKIEEIVASGSAQTMKFLSYLNESGLNIDPRMTEFRGEEGLLWNIISSGEVWKWNSVLAQVGADEINYLRQYDKYFHLYYKSAPRLDGYVQEIYIPLVKITSPLDLKFKNEARNLPVEFTALSPKAALAVTPNALSIVEDAQGNIPYGVIYESNNPVGEVTTQVGTIYSTIV
ncbi:MAG: hypothetical protein H3C35_03705 [Bacteroidetes bacterium]|nr:hypothetical protein [Bacteroidota bacterium]